MRFVHFADCHIDGYKDPRLAKLGHDNFKYVIDFAIKKEVDFILLAGDLFNTALPRVDALKFVTGQFKRVAEKNIPIYIIPGSHDYSPHGRTMLDVLELAGLVINVAKAQVDEEGLLQLSFTQDEKTKVFITGIMGRAGMLDQQLYQKIDIKNIPSGPNIKKIFMFHTAIHELKTPALAAMDASPLDLLPAGFDYYAGGHVHIINSFSSERYKNVVYPGPTFPNSFSELEDLGGGSFVFYENDRYTHQLIPSKKVVSLSINVNKLSSEEVYDQAKISIAQEDVENKIILLRFSGILEGKSSDIDIKSLVEDAYAQGAYVVLRNTNKLQSKLFEEITSTTKASQDIEKDTIEEHLQQISFVGDEAQVIKELLQQLNIEQGDGEKKTIFEERVISIAKSIIE